MFLTQLQSTHPRVLDRLLLWLSCVRKQMSIEHEWNVIATLIHRADLSGGYMRKDTWDTRQLSKEMRCEKAIKAKLEIVVS